MLLEERTRKRYGVSLQFTDIVIKSGRQRTGKRRDAPPRLTCICLEGYQKGNQKTEVSKTLTESLFLLQQSRTQLQHQPEFSRQIHYQKSNPVTQHPMPYVAETHMESLDTVSHLL